MKSYFRFLSRNRLYTFINVAGLVVSLMFIILMGDYTWRQYSIDRWHRNADRIYMIGDESGFFMWPQAAAEIKDMCPEVEQTCCLLSEKGKIKYGDRTVKDGENENGIILLADSTFFQFFDFELLKGDRQTALDAPDKCVITERLAKRLFGETDPIGESLQIVGDRHVWIGNEDPYDSTLVYTVQAVVQDFDHTVLPNETQLIASMQRYPQVVGYKLSNNNGAYGASGPAKVLLMLHPGLTLDDKKNVIKNHLSQNYRGNWGGLNVCLTKLTDVLFAPQNNGRGLIKGDKTRLYILLAAVLAILFFAISNYINLTIANTGFRAKEMATRRLFGSSQYRISLKLIMESMLMVTVSFAVGLALAFYLQKEAAALFKGKIDLMNDITVGTVSICLLFILFLGIISGIVPSRLISRYQPIDIVKGNFRFHSKMILGKVFIILQNVITVAMLTSAFVIWLQLRHLIYAPLGYNTENLYYIMCDFDKTQLVRDRLEKMPFVEKIGLFQNTAFAGHGCSMQIIRRDEKQIVVFKTQMDKNAFDLYGLEVLKDDGPTDGGYYLNEEALRQLDYTEETQEIDWGSKKDPIAGVLRDFHRINVLQELEPFAISLEEDLKYPNFLVKTNGYKGAKVAFESMLKDMNVSDEEMKWYVNSLEENIAETFEDQRNTLKIISLFTFVAIVISVLGFIGMSLFFIRQRQKEIGIRKIMGSTSREVMLLMLRTFCSPLLVSFAIAIPLSWYIMNDWLTNFSYRITLSPWIFATTCAFALLVAVLSVGFQIIKAVRTNPVESIKTE